ncbi:MAG TPA: formate dehydrogenase-N subunit alpha, partial [Thermodesulfobacteriota bacterium]|nr:formate dehydrogenase-N subunit alpha [Thermodesulfobacteriota bacterium]
GMIKHVIENKLYFEEYVREYTNASFLVSPDFKTPGDNNGVFSGLQGTQTEQGFVDGKYDKTTWSYQKDEKGVPKKDPTLQDPNCVFQLLKRHFSRYDLEMVSRITGTPKEKLLAVYQAYAKTGVPDKAGTVLYAMGWTQHTVGVQNIRAMSILQLLLGNMGMAGGGINAMRGESNVQGSTDHGLLFHIYPGYLKAVKASLPGFKDYLTANTPVFADPMSANWWQNYPKYAASFLREMYGPDVPLDQAYQYLPKIDDGVDYSWMTIFDQLYQGKLTGFFAWGQNPACSGPNANKTREGLKKLDWLVNVNIFDNETASFWQGPGMNPKEIKTEVFMLPCAASYEKEGSLSNSGRWMQWRYKASNPPGSALPDADIINALYAKVKKLYAKEKGPKADPIVNLSWNYGPKDDKGNVKHVDPHMVAKSINGYFLQDKVINGRLYSKGTLVPMFASLQDDGSTSSGNWLYCGSYTGSGNMSARRAKEDPSGLGLYPGWAWAWPVNRRIIYNRASVDKNGNPWAPAKAVITWRNGAWVGDVPDGPWPPLAAGAASRYPFIMQADGVGHIFGPGLNDGPFPEHYEPTESPLDKNPLSPQQVNPAVKRWDRVEATATMNACAISDTRFPIVCSTYRVTEHWQTGVMTRWQPWLVEMEPAMFVEMGEDLAALKQIKNGDVVTVKSIRGEVDAVAVVTARVQAFTINGKTVHQIGIPYHYGWVTSAERRYNVNNKKPELFTFGDSANLVTPNIGDANTMIPESKCFMVDVVRKG